MLPQITLDNERFPEIVEKARKQLPGLHPEWTDYNYHDPGTTLLELLAWFKEIQQFHLDGIGPAHRLKYLKLMGIKPLKRKLAEGEIGIEGLLEEVFLQKGSRFYAGDICFETKEAVTLGTSCVVKLAVCGEKVPNMKVTQNGMRFFAFGASPKEGAELLIGLDHPLPPGQRQNLHFHFLHDMTVIRNPFGDNTDFIPLAEIEFSYLSKEGYQVITEWDDFTHQMLADGFFSFELCDRMSQGEEGLYWLKLELKRCNYEVAPIIENIGLHQIRIEQKRTLIESHEGRLDDEGSIFLQTHLAEKGGYQLFIKKEDKYYRYCGKSERIRKKRGVVIRLPAQKEINCCVICYEEGWISNLEIAFGTGLPYQEYECRIQDLCIEGLAVMVETEEGSDCYEFWEYRDDFCASGPMDRHFHFDEETGVLSFGNCDRGMAPQGRILLAAGHQSLGMSGNVKAESISRSDENIRCERISNSREAAGGTNAESLEECTRRMKMQLKDINRAVTYEDYEKMAKMTPGLMIENVRAIPVTERKQQDGTLKGNTVSIVVKPYAREERPELNKAYCKNLLQWLEPKRMIGTKIDILSPEYVGISIFAEIETTAYEAIIKENVREVLIKYFQEIRAEFGAVIHYSVVYGILDVLENVIRIKSLSIDAQGKTIRRSRNGDMVLPVNGLPYLRECIVTAHSTSSSLL